MKKEVKNFFLTVLVLLLLLPVAFAAIGSSGNYNSWTKIDFLGYNSTGSNHQSRGSGDIITGSFSISTTYSGRFGILKHCGNDRIDSGESCDGTNLNGKTCSTQGYLSGTLTCSSDCSFDTSSCTPHPPSVRENIPSGTDSGGAPSPTKFSSTTGVDVGKGELAALTTAQGAKFMFNHVEHLVDIKEIGEDYVRLWVYSDPIEVLLFVGKRANVDVDGDGWADIRIELRGITNNNAFLYFKELKGPAKITLPKGEKVVIEEQFELPKITLLPKVRISTKAWMKSLQDFGSFVKENIGYFGSLAQKKIGSWIEFIKKEKQWFILGSTLLAFLLLVIIIIFKFGLHEGLKEKLKIHKRLKEKLK